MARIELRICMPVFRSWLSTLNAHPCWTRSTLPQSLVYLIYPVHDGSFGQMLVINYENQRLFVSAIPGVIQSCNFVFAPSYPCPRQFWHIFSSLSLSLSRVYDGLVSQSLCPTLAINFQDENSLLSCPLRHCHCQCRLSLHAR
jgi:hypothetical protein